MWFYKINATYRENEEIKGNERRNRRGQNYGLGGEIAEVIRKKVNGAGKDTYMFVTSCYDERIDMGLCTKENIDAVKMAEEVLNIDKFSITNIKVDETTFNIFSSMLSRAEDFNYLDDSLEDVLRDYDLYEIYENKHRYPPIEWSESVFKESDRQSIYERAEKLFTRDSFMTELDRIYTGEKKKHFVGNPVEYLVEIFHESQGESVSNLLCQALYDMNRLLVRRCVRIELRPDSRIDKKCLSALYNMSYGGVIIVTIKACGAEGGNLAYGDLDILEKFCEDACKFRNDVLTVFCFDKRYADVRKKIYENMNGCTFVEIEEDEADYERAVRYLSDKASDYRVRPNKKLFALLDENSKYYTPELNTVFDNWYGKKLKTSVFGQYKDIEAVDTKIAREKPKGSAYDDLNKMIGLGSAKEVVNQAIDCFKAQKLFKDKGMEDSEFSRHMIFTGNPGTAKTTVARLFTQIMKDNGIIDKGRIVEVGRADLIGRFVGWTAPTVKKKFEEAQGGVLFIDEAYSLVDDSNSFGDEAINTIVQEMENHRNDVIVIFAGYPDKMEEFMRKNPGLRSRIAYHVHFDDYTPDELCSIGELIAEKKKLKLEAEALKKLHTIMESAVKQSDFGNGRYVRNIIEKAQKAQRSRLVKMDIDAVTKKDIQSIIAADIEMPDICPIKEKNMIGFAG